MLLGIVKSISIKTVLKDNIWNVNTDKKYYEVKK